MSLAGTAGMMGSVHMCRTTSMQQWQSRRHGRRDKAEPAVVVVIHDMCGSLRAACMRVVAQPALQQAAAEHHRLGDCTNCGAEAIADTSYTKGNPGSTACKPNCQCMSSLSPLLDDTPATLAFPEPVQHCGGKCLRGPVSSS